MVGAIIMVSEGLCQIIWVFVMGVVTPNAVHFMIFAIALNTASAIVCYWVPESPRYLYGINELEKCSKVLAYIAKANGIKDYEMARFDVEYQIMVEDLDGDDGEEIAVAIRPTEKTEEIKAPNDTKDGNFDSLLSQRDKDGTKNKIY